jgi:hypothetical protein
VQIHKYNGNPIGLQLPPHVELKVTYTEPGVRGDTASGGVTKLATLETGLEIRVPLFIKEWREGQSAHGDAQFAGRALGESRWSQSQVAGHQPSRSSVALVKPVTVAASLPWYTKTRIHEDFSSE